MIFLVAGNRPDGHERGKTKQCKKLMGDALQVATTYENGANGIDEIAHRIDVGGGICPRRHGAGWGEESAEQKHADDKEPHDEDSLLHGVAVVGDNEAQAAEEQSQKHGKKIYQQQRALAGNAIDEPREYEADGDE